ncbi:hypothetical protein OPT61_g2498 [Boeremia exigua]|uniref:Uncharacterized protein n=1 Tax=Boeremia exigua TaxID=749465 RepID=A0ACC2ILB3_9PLEO|nr:hypothetical protein OPT61_g2498 [Boeremia exigua]
MAGAMEKIKAKVENVLHKDKDTTHTGTHSSTHNDPTGPHSSHAANQADPRVDSDRLGTAGNTAGAGGVGAGQYGTTGTHGTTGSGLTGTHGTTGSGLTGSHTTHGSDPTGPHDSRLANKADPRVDSDRVGPSGNSASIGGYGNETHTSGLNITQVPACLTAATTTPVAV